MEVLHGIFLECSPGPKAPLDKLLIFKALTGFLACYGFGTKRTFGLALYRCIYVKKTTRFTFIYIYSVM